jgi:hypothetical protein
MSELDAAKIRRRRKKAEAAKQWRKNNPEASKKKARDRYNRDTKAAASKVQKWRKDHPEQWSHIQRACNLRTKYGLSIDAYASLLKSQKGRCAVCGTLDPQSRNGANRPGEFAVDHDHETGEIRGLLCNPCNTGLGLFKEDPKRLKKAARYLLQTRRTYPPT